MRFKDTLNEADKVVVYDNGGKTADRYTVIIGNDMYNMSSNATSPQGVNMHAGEIGKEKWDVKPPGPHLGKKISINKLPNDVKKAIKERQKRK